MPNPKVFFANMWASDDENLQQKLRRLINAAEFGKMELERRFVAVKIHFGELGNLSYLRPNYARTIVDMIKEQGGLPFLTDSNTLYVGNRKNALDHIETAYVNGFSPFSTGCHIIIADGLKGTDDVSVPVPGAPAAKAAKIGRALMDADAVVTLSHFKCHELTGIGGALKNIGMGAASRAGKMDQHTNGKPAVDGALCIGCGKCVAVCACHAPVVANGKSTIDTQRCVGCGRCIGVCPTDAIEPTGNHANKDLSSRMAEYAAAALVGRPHFHVSLVTQVSPLCDCHGSNDIPIVPDVGMFASFDPVALDKACADAVNRQPVYPGSVLERAPAGTADYFNRLHPATNWHDCLNRGQELGLGRMEYELVEI